MVSANDGKEELVKLWAFALISLFLIFENISMNFDENLKKEKRKKKKEKKSQNDVSLAQLTARHNWSLTEYQIDNNWKLND